MLSDITPALILPGQSFESLSRLSRIHTEFDESFLQELLEAQPGLLPIQSLRSDVGSLLCIGREVAVASGFIDNLYLSSSGYVVVVETKLWRNPEARREVLSQMLDYIKDISKKDFEWLEAQWKISRKDTKSVEATLLTAISDLDPDGGQTSFVDRVNRALERGDILAMIVGDGIETRLQELVNHLCRDSAQLRYSLALCELAFYRLGKDESAGMIVVPRIVQNIEPVQRAYVRLDFADDLQRQLKVTPQMEEKPKTASSTGIRINLSEDEFLKSVEQSAGKNVALKVKETYEDLINTFGLEPDFKASSVMLKILHPEDEKPGASILAFDKTGKVYNSEFMRNQLNRWPLNEADAITFKYWKTLHEVDARFGVEGMSHKQPQLFIPLTDLLSKWPDIKRIIGQAVTDVNMAFEAQH